MILGFDSKDCFLFFPSFLVLKWKTKHHCFFVLWDFKPKMLKNQKQPWVFCFFWDLVWSYPFKSGKKVFFCLSISKPKNKKLGQTNKNNLLSQNQTFSQKFCFFWFAWFCFVFPVFVCFSRCGPSFSSFRFQAQATKESRNMVFFPYKYGCRHYWLHERVKQMIAWSRPGGEVVRQKFWISHCHWTIMHWIL